MAAIVVFGVAVLFHVAAVDGDDGAAGGGGFRIVQLFRGVTAYGRPQTGSLLHLLFFVSSDGLFRINTHFPADALLGVGPFFLGAADAFPRSKRNLFFSFAELVS